MECHKKISPGAESNKCVDSVIRSYSRAEVSLAVTLPWLRHSLLPQLLRLLLHTVQSPASAMTSVWVDECARVTALISATRGGCISNGMRLSSECTRLDHIVSKLRSPTEHEQWEATIIAAQELLKQREQQQREQQQRERQKREPDWSSWRHDLREFVAESLSPAPQPVDQHDWEGSVVRWARSVLDVQAEVDKLSILAQLAALEEPEHTSAEQREEEQTEQMVAKQSERVGQLLVLLEAQTQLNPAAAANAGSEALFV